MIIDSEISKHASEVKNDHTSRYVLKLEMFLFYIIPTYDNFRFDS